jgi:predicted acyltransferase
MRLKDSDTQENQKEKKIANGEKQNIPPSRVMSIDALRGFDMFWIIGGGELVASFVKLWKGAVSQKIEQQLSHVDWEGFRFEDLIFPLFVFIVGVVLPFSMSRRLQQGQSRKRIFLHIIVRAAVLILLGLILNGLLRFNWPEMRWPGVLQRIGLCYFFAAVIVLHTKWRTQVIIAAAILILYWAAMMLIPIPVYGSGALTKEGCLSSYIDQKVIPGVLYYKYGDNEGVLSTLPAICTALLGALAGHWLRSNRSGNLKAAGLMLAGIASLIAGYFWGMVFPIIKIIWTSSYVLYAGGWSLLLLAFFYWIIDVKRWKRWAFFFTVIGANPITIYFLRGLVDFDGIAGLFLAGLARYAGPAGPLVLLTGVVIIEWLFLWFLFRHRIFFKV